MKCRQGFSLSNKMKEEVKGVFDKLARSIEYCLGKPLSGSFSRLSTIGNELLALDFSSTASIEHKFNLVVGEYEEFRKEFSASKGEAMLSVSKLNNVKLQTELQRFIELTDRFEQIEAKQQGMCSKLLSILKNTPKSLVRIEGTISNIGSDNSESTKLKNELHLEKAKNSELEKVAEDLKQERDSELRQVKDNLAEYIEIANRQYRQIDIFKERVELLKGLVPAVNDFLKAMDNLSLIAKEERDNDILAAKQDFNNKKETLLKILACIFHYDSFNKFL
eukprot:TRINITY_DN2793_c0_g4_i3.p2 TRINITY_DN2793_c0_g4~~TRINITY_DN2793_c0_g4_i3.p2  ORF type:complete len:278 (-),score=34.03 TRINITY_DN2793_c0_g4_i3:97-930(-)